MVPLATGTDGGGSIRIPSACCGIAGMKPSLGRVPTGGVDPPGWPDLSTGGPMARRVVDIALALDTVLGPDPSDLRSLPMPEASWSGAVEDAHVPMRVAWSPTLGYADPSPDVRLACERAVLVLEELGADVVVVDDVFPEDPLSTWIPLVAAYLTRTVEDRGAEDDLEEATLRPYIEIGRTLAAADLVRAIDDCHRLNQRLLRVFSEHRVLLTPTTACAAPPSGGLPIVDGEPVENWVRYTYPFNLTRSPAGTICAGVTDDGLPVGVQIVGPQHGDQVVLRTMAALEAALGLAQPPRPVTTSG
jgi:Asp-tRNA(Asn)/Glu-tRNA(Gln) amidotransferase A subunit family amidase